MWDGDDPACTHKWGDEIESKGMSGGTKSSTLGETGHPMSEEGLQRTLQRSQFDAPRSNAFCDLCGAWRGCLGLEPTPDLYVAHLVLIGREIRRVLHPTGTFWLNLGDSYMAHSSRDYSKLGSRPHRVPGLKDKDLVGVPWRAALALQADGWWLRNDIIWRKKNAQPSSVRDRFSCKHEHVFLFAKQARYFFDLDAVRIPHTSGTYQPDGSFEPSQNWFELGEGTRKMDKTEGQMGPLAASPRRKGRGTYNGSGKNPGDIASFLEERERFLPLPGQCHAVILGVDDFRNSATFISRVVDQLENAATRVGFDLARADPAQAGEAVAHIAQKFRSTRPVQPNLTIFRGSPYTTITIEQAPDHVRVEFGRCRWILRHKGLPGNHSKKAQVVRHSFAVNGEGVDSLLVLVNWVVGLPFPADVFDQLCVFRREAHGDGSSPALDATIGDHQTEDVRHLRSPATKIAFIEGLLAVALHQTRIAMPVPSLVVHPAPASGTGGPITFRDVADFYVPIIALEPTQGNHTGDVWDVATGNYKGAHFAVWPSELVERFILAGTSAKGRCPTCKTPWKRVIEKQGGSIKKVGTGENLTGNRKGDRNPLEYDRLKFKGAGGIEPQQRITTGWEPSCGCDMHEPERCVVLDPFSGSGTTGWVAMRLDRNYVGLDLNQEYLSLAQARLEDRKAPQSSDEPDLIGELFG